MSDEKSLEAPAEDWRPRGANTTVMALKSNKGSKDRKERSNDTPRGADRSGYGYTLQGGRPAVVQKNGTYIVEGSPRAEESIGGMDFFFEACVRSPCNNELVEDVDTLGAEDNAGAGGGTVVDDGKYVTRTFHWRPEDFPLEVATYMQNDDPIDSTVTENDVMMEKMRAKAFASKYRAQNQQEVPGRRCTAQPNRAAADDMPDDMLDDEFSLQDDMEEPAVPAASSASAPAGPRREAEAPQQSVRRGTNLLDFAVDEVVGPAAAPAAAPAEKEKAAGWSPDWQQADAGASDTPAKDLIPHDKALEVYPIFTPQHSVLDPLQAEDLAAAERKSREEELAAQVRSQAAEIERLKQALATASSNRPPISAEVAQPGLDHQNDAGL